MSFHSLLNSIIDSQSVTKNSLINETGIDRSSFYQILSGKRIPTKDQITNIIRQLDISAADEMALYDAFYLERLGETTSKYIANLIQEYYNMMENQKGGIQMTEKGRTMAFQIPEELFQRIKRHLERETLRTGKKLTQRDFVLNLITQALDEADAENTEEQNTPTEAPAEARVDDEATPAGTDTPDAESAV
jgi:transcriptional regulator with XRE-family HTH domain